MTEEQAIYEAAAIEAMHTGMYADLEYTPIAERLPELVRAEDVAALRTRVAELEAQLAAVPVDALLRYCHYAEARSYPDASATARGVGAGTRSAGAAPCMCLCNTRR